MTKKLAIIICVNLFYCNNAQPQDVDTLINVGTHDLHFKIVEGKGMPILFEAGNGDNSSVWKDLLKPLHEATGATLITYDRAGLGKSGLDTLTVSLKNEVKNLMFGLIKLGYGKHLFLVIHSFGGFYSTLFATKNENKVKGAVFIDVALPCFFTEEWSKEFVESIKEENWKMIREYKPGLYYVLANLESISDYMSNKSLPERYPLRLLGLNTHP